MSNNTNKMQLALNSAVSSARNMWSRWQLASRGVGFGLDTKRSMAWCEYGFPEEVTNAMLYNLYRRGGVAHGAVEKVIGACWKTPPELIQGSVDDQSKSETAWEKSTAKVLQRKQWRLWAEADRRRTVARYSALILRIKDSQAWDQPVAGGPKVLEEMIPVWSSTLKPVEIDTDTKSATYGKPKFWQYTEQAAGGVAGRSLKIHPDRIFVLGDWAEDAIGWLEPAYNAFVSLEKVEGGSGESFLKNASRQISVNFDKEVNLASLASTYGVSVSELQEKFNEATREMNRGNDQMLITQGAQVSPLVAEIADPQPTYGVNLQTVAAALDIPSKILVGMQTGERASSEDQKYFNARCQARREDLSFEIQAFAEHLIRIKVLGAMAEFSVLWDDLSAQTKTEQLDSAERMSKINASSLALGELVFSADEIRTAAGYEPAEIPLPEIPEDDEDDTQNGNRPPAAPAPGPAQQG